MLELVGREVAEARVSAGSVVEGLDVVEHRRAELAPSAPRVTVDELLFERREEALGDGVAKQSPREPIETAMPASRACWPKARDTY